jgi:phosphopantetheinyl transferase (holo-ACP synthase)
MLNDLKSINEIMLCHLGKEFYLEMIPLTNKSRDPFEKKTKNRFDLRTALYNYLKETKKFVFEDALDLRNVPQKFGGPDKDYYSSLSHTDEIGVFAVDSYPIGIDYENKDRIKKEIVERVCIKDELNLSSDFQILWSIKEAAFKAIPFIVQPKTMTDITVTKITSLQNKLLNGYHSFSFSADLKKASSTNIEGVCLSNSTHQLAIAKAFSKK